MRRDCGTKSLAREIWFVISPSKLSISKKLFLSFATNVKLLDIFWLASAIFFFLKVYCDFVDWLVKYTASWSRFLKNVDEVFFSSLDFSKIVSSVSKNLSATSKIFSVMASVYNEKKQFDVMLCVKIKQKINFVQVKNWDNFTVVGA